MEPSRQPDAIPPAREPAAVPSQIGPLGPETLWQAFCRTTDEYVVIVDRDGVIRFCNRVGPGLTAGDVVGHAIYEFTNPDSTEVLHRAIDRVFDTGLAQETETRVTTPVVGIDEFALRLGPLVCDGRVEAVLICCRSVLALHESQRSLARQHDALRRLLDTQDQERQLISYEIHDGLAQYVAGALLHLQAAERPGLPPAAAQPVAETLRLLRAAAEESRRLMAGLRPPALDQQELVAAVGDLVAAARDDVPEIDYTHTFSGERLPLPLETAIYRIVQESLSNVRKHARATRAAVLLERLPHGVRVRVQDDGAGFDLRTVPQDRFGLEGIRRRAQVVRATTRIESAPGSGTTVEVEFPLVDD
jgi:signal transduction histidine kinase